MKRDITQVFCKIVELGCIVGLAAIGLKRNRDCFIAQCKLIDEQIEHTTTKFESSMKDVRIKELEQKLNNSVKEEA